MARKKEKFAMNQEVFYMKDNKIIKDSITAIRSLWKDSKKKDEVELYAYQYNFGTREDQIQWNLINEEALFPTRAELIKSL